MINSALTFASSSVLKDPLILAKAYTPFSLGTAPFAGIKEIKP